MRTNLEVLAAVVGMVGGLLVTGEGAIAHGTCAPQASTPVKDPGTITAHAKIVCQDQHAKYNIWVALQKRQSDGSWTNVAGPTLTTSFNTDVANGTASKSCTNGTYRSRMTEGRVYNASNVQVHPDSGAYTDTSGTNTISC
jgi:hypothetical protein